MKLSDAMMLPSAIPFDAGTYLEPTGGCLLGQALNVVTGQEWGNCSDILKNWPWLKDRFLIPTCLVEAQWTNGLAQWTNGLEEGKRYVGECIVTWFAFRVQAGKLTREQAADWVRSVEPTEPEELCIDQTELILSDHVAV